MWKIAYPLQMVQSWVVIFVFIIMAKLIGLLVKIIGVNKVDLYA